MELEGNIPSMVQESLPPSDASFDKISGPVGSCTTEGLQQSASSNSLSLSVGYTRNFAEVCFHFENRLSHVMRKPALCHMRTTKVQISLRIPTV